MLSTKDSPSPTLVKHSLRRLSRVIRLVLTDDDDWRTLAEQSLDKFDISFESRENSALDFSRSDDCFGWKEWR